MRFFFGVLLLLVSASGALAETDKRLNGDVTVSVGQEIKPFTSPDTSYKVIQILDQTRNIICYAIVSERGPSTGTTPPSSCVKFF